MGYWVWFRALGLGKGLGFRVERGLVWREVRVERGENLGLSVKRKWGLGFRVLSTRGGIWD